MEYIKNEKSYELARAFMVTRDVVKVLKIALAYGSCYWLWEYYDWIRQGVGPSTSSTMSKSNNSWIFSSTLIFKSVGLCYWSHYWVNVVCPLPSF